jgi:hypothetical protein
MPSTLEGYTVTVRNTPQGTEIILNYFEKDSQGNITGQARKTCPLPQTVLDAIDAAVQTIYNS